MFKQLGYCSCTRTRNQEITWPLAKLRHTNFSYIYIYLWTAFNTKFLCFHCIYYFSMVLLVERFGRAFRFPSRLDHHPSHDRDEQVLLASSLRAFRSEVSKLLTQILAGSEFLSLAWYQKCFEAIPLIHRAFAALVLDIDHPMLKWDAVAADDYLNYSLDVLDLLNKVSFSLTQFGQARLSLAHGLNLFQNSKSSSSSSSSSAAAESKYFVPVCPKQIGKDLKLHGSRGIEENSGSGKDSVIREALLIVKSTGILLLGFVISGLYSDGNLYSSVIRRNSAGGFADPSVTNLDSILSKQISDNGGCMVKEVREVNSAVAALTRTRHGCRDAAKDLSTKLDVLESLLKNLGKQTDNIFSEVLAARNKLLDTVRQKHKN